ncbi:MAG: hypothetical protein AAF411_16435 [Myxococcota bacterium]
MTDAEVDALPVDGGPSDLALAPDAADRDGAAPAEDASADFAMGDLGPRADAVVIDSAIDSPGAEPDAAIDAALDTPGESFVGGVPVALAGEITRAGPVRLEWLDDERVLWSERTAHVTRVDGANLLTLAPSSPSPFPSAVAATSERSLIAFSLQDTSVNRLHRPELTLVDGALTPTTRRLDELPRMTELFAVFAGDAFGIWGTNDGRPQFFELDELASSVSLREPPFASFGRTESLAVVWHGGSYCVAYHRLSGPRTVNLTCTNRSGEIVRGPVAFEETFSGHLPDVASDGNDLYIVQGDGDFEMLLHRIDDEGGVRTRALPDGRPRPVVRSVALALNDIAAYVATIDAGGQARLHSFDRTTLELLETLDVGEAINLDIAVRGNAVAVVYGDDDGRAWLRVWRRR